MPGSEFRIAAERLSSTMSSVSLSNRGSRQRKKSLVPAYRTQASPSDQPMDHPSIRVLAPFLFAVQPLCWTGSLSTWYLLTVSGDDDG